MSTSLAEATRPLDGSIAHDVPASEWIAENVTLKRRSEMQPEERARMEQLAFSYGTAPESYDIVISDGSILTTPCGQGILSVLPHRRYWHMPGGMMVPEELKRDCVQWLHRVSVANRKTVAVYSVAEEDVPLFLDAGYEVSKFGEEPLLDLGDITWKGKNFEWVRRQTNLCLRAGLKVEEVVDEQARHDLAEELVEILHEDLNTRTYSKPLRLLEGEFDPFLLFRRRLFVARAPDTGRIEGFLACSPMLNGQAWGFETYRKRNDAVRGTIPFLFRSVIDQLQQEGVRLVSLCLVPGKGATENPNPSSSFLVRFSLSMWYERLNFLFNTRGQNYFKTRFRPRFVNRYICVTPGTTPRSIMSFLGVAGALRPNILNIFRNFRRSFTQKLPD